MELIIITEPDFFGGEIGKLQRMFEAGLQTLHVRKPEAHPVELSAWLESFTPEQKARMMLHDHYELVADHGLKGLHHPVAKQGEQGRRQAAQFRASHPGFKTSLALHDLEHGSGLEEAYDYGLLSPIFPSISKPGHGPQFSAEAISQAVAQSRLPLYALGGITLQTLPQAKAMGFQGVCVLGAIWQDANPVERFKELYQAISKL